MSDRCGLGAINMRRVMEYGLDTKKKRLEKL